MSDYVFKGLETAQTFENGTFLEAGPAGAPGHKYTVEIVKTLTKKVRKGYQALIVELTVIDSTSDKNKPGTKATWMQNLENDSAPGAVKLFMYACVGVDASDKASTAVIDPQLDGLTNEAIKGNSLKGTRLNVEVRNKPTKAGQDFSLHVFSPAAQVTKAA